MVWLSAAALFFVGIAIPGNASPGEAGDTIDTQRSFITIHVGKAGLLAAAAHEHWVIAPIAGGVVEAEGPRPSVRFTVNSSKLAVKPDKGVSEKDQADVQSNLQDKVLESSTYPEIAFQSTQVERVGDNVWRVAGNLTLHGVTRPVLAVVKSDSHAYIGTTRIKQTTFGIQPITIGRGIVRVKDELEISFQVYTDASADHTLPYSKAR